MTRKDYEATAHAIAQVTKDWAAPNGGMLTRETRHLLEDIADALADVFAADNPRFDRGRFVSACYPNED